MNRLGTLVLPMEIIASFQLGNSCMTDRVPISLHLKCEGITDPIRLDTKRPRFSWHLETGRNGANQVAYHIQVASSPESLRRVRSPARGNGKATR